MQSCPLQITAAISRTCHIDDASLLGHGFLLVRGQFGDLVSYSVLGFQRLVYWEEKKWPYTSGFYMGVYAGRFEFPRNSRQRFMDSSPCRGLSLTAIGASQALTNFIMGCTFAAMVYFASVSLHHQAVMRIMHAPMSFFE